MSQRSSLSSLLGNLCDMFEHAQMSGEAVVIKPDLVTLFAQAMREGLAMALALEATALERDDLLEIARDLELVGVEDAPLPDAPRPSAEIIDIAGLLERERRDAQTSVRHGQVRIDSLRQLGGEVVPLQVITRSFPTHPDGGDAA